MGIKSVAVSQTEADSPSSSNPNESLFARQFTWEAKVCVIIALKLAAETIRILIIHLEARKWKCLFW